MASRGEGFGHFLGGHWVSGERQSAGRADVPDVRRAGCERSGRVTRHHGPSGLRRGR